MCDHKEIIDLLCAIRDRAKQRGVEFADFRAHRREGTSIILENRTVDRVESNRVEGVGIRILMQGSWGFASSDGVTAQELEDALDRAFRAAKALQGPGVTAAVIATPVPSTGRWRIHGEVDPRSVPVESKVNLLRKIESDSIGVSPDRILNTQLSYFDEWTQEALLNTVGTELVHSTTRVRAAMEVAAGNGALRGFYRKSIGQTGGFELLDGIGQDHFGIQTARNAVELLTAGSPPSGVFPVVLAPSIAGSFVHEMLGHCAEADSVQGSGSIIGNLIGTQIASKGVTIVDDPTIEGGHGSFRYDSEGVPGSRRILVENGILKGFLHSLETAGRAGVEPTGSGRSQNHGSPPLPRMSNTFIAQGSTPFTDLIAGIDLGLFLEDCSWGASAPEEGNFEITARKARMIRRGELAEPLRGVTVSGHVLDALKDIDGVGNDLRLCRSGSLCGKAGQMIPVDEGSPSIRVKSLLVGGRG